MSNTKKIVVVLAIALVLLGLIGGVLLAVSYADPYTECEQICSDEASVIETTGFNATLWEERANASLITHEKVEALRSLINTRCRLEITYCIEKVREVELKQKREALIKRNREAGVPGYA